MTVRDARGGARVRVAAFIALIVALCGARIGTAVAAPTVALPPLVGHVVDPAHQLTSAEATRLDNELEGLRARTGHAVVVLVLASLAGEPIEDVAYRAFNQWGVGGAGVDDGVLLVVSTGDRRVRIETGKGVGGALTDLQSNDIIRLQIGPALAKGQLYAGLEAGVQAIAAALAKDPTLAPPTRAPPSGARSTSGDSSMTVLILVGVMIVLGIGAAVSPAIRGVLWPVLRVLGGILRILAMFSGRGGGSGSGRDRYRGGGGRSGGGGSSGSY